MLRMAADVVAVLMGDSGGPTSAACGEDEDGAEQLFSPPTGGEDTADPFIGGRAGEGTVCLRERMTRAGESPVGGLLRFTAAAAAADDGSSARSCGTGKGGTWTDVAAAATSPFVVSETLIVWEARSASRDGVEGGEEGAAGAAMSDGADGLVSVTSSAKGGDREDGE